MKFDLSIVIPYFHKLDRFRNSIKINADEFFQVKEILLLIDHPITTSESTSLLQLLHVYGLHDLFKIYVNTIDHDWRNPAIVINYGIEHAIGKYVLVMSPETILSKGAISQLIPNCDGEYCIGNIVFFPDCADLSLIEIEQIYSRPPSRTDKYIGPVYFGSICTNRKNFIDVGLYPNYMDWGGEDDDIRSKLKSNQIKERRVESARLIHYETPDEFKIRLIGKKTAFKATDHINNKCLNFQLL